LIDAFTQDLDSMMSGAFDMAFGKKRAQAQQHQCVPRSRGPASNGRQSDSRLLLAGALRAWRKSPRPSLQVSKSSELSLWFLTELRGWV
jgi:hypothetical protein